MYSSSMSHHSERETTRKRKPGGDTDRTKPSHKKPNRAPRASTWNHVVMLGIRRSSSRGVRFADVQPQYGPVDQRLDDAGDLADRVGDRIHEAGHVWIRGNVDMVAVVPTKREALERTGKEKQTNDQIFRGCVVHPDQSKGRDAQPQSLRKLSHADDGPLSSFDQVQSQHPRAGNDKEAQKIWNRSQVAEVFKWNPLLRMEKCGAPVRRYSAHPDRAKVVQADDQKRGAREHRPPLFVGREQRCGRRWRRRLVCRGASCDDDRGQTNVVGGIPVALSRVVNVGHVTIDHEPPRDGHAQTDAARDGKGDAPSELVDGNVHPDSGENGAQLLARVHRVVDKGSALQLDFVRDDVVERRVEAGAEKAEKEHKSVKNGDHCRVIYIAHVTAATTTTISTILSSMTSSMRIRSSIRSIRSIRLGVKRVDAQREGRQRQAPAEAGDERADVGTAAHDEDAAGDLKHGVREGEGAEDEAALRVREGQAEPCQGLSQSQKEGECRGRASSDRKPVPDVVDPHRGGARQYG